MSKLYTASQFEASYRPTRLGNWEVPASPRSRVPKARTSTTKFIVDANGHLLPGARTQASSFPDAKTPPTYRWPEKTVLSTDAYCGAATMG
jgi:hypothetical protein